mgnify:CR=1 FL=1
MNLEELKQIRDSLKECKPGVEDFSWGPSLEFAEKRKKDSLRILNREIKELKNAEKEFYDFHNKEEN